MSRKKVSYIHYLSGNPLREIRATNLLAAAHSWLGQNCVTVSFPPGFIFSAVNLKIDEYKKFAGQ